MGEDVEVDFAGFSQSGILLNFSIQNICVYPTFPKSLKHFSSTETRFNAIGQGSWRGYYPGGSILTA